MNLIKFLDDFLADIDSDNLFLSVLPAFYALFTIDSVFNCDYKCCGIMFWAVLFLHLSIKFYDDFHDWTEGKTSRLKELEQTGMRGRFDKSIYFYEKSPRKYFYIALIPVLLFITALIYIAVCQKSPLIFLIAIIIPILGFINYSSKTKFIMEKIGSETVIALLCSFITMFLVFFAGTKYITLNLLSVSATAFFLIFNICYISSILNLKVDIMTEKTTFAVSVKNQTARICFLIFFTLLPFLLTYFAILFNMLPKASYLSFLLIPHSIWLIYLVILYEREPHKQIKWHFLMGPNKYRVLDEQNNLSWYNIRYKLARNIFCIYIFILIITNITM